MKSFVQVVSVSILGLSMVACSTFSKEECMNKDWQVIAFEEGYKGNPRIQETYNYYANTCGRDHKIYPSKEKMELGYQQGLKQYCTAEGGLRAGSSGLTYANVCGENTAKDFMKTYQPARLAWLETDYKRLQKENEELRSENGRLRSQVGSLQGEVSSLQGQVSSAQSTQLFCN